MPRLRNPNRAKAYEIYKEHGGNITNREIAKLLGEDEKVVAVWKSRDKWNVVQQSNESCTTNKKGGQPGNKNASGHGAPKKNSNAEKHGLFRKYLPEETFSIIQDMPSDPLDVLWDQIQIAYAAVIRAQQIMYVRDREDKTIEKVEEKSGNVLGESWEVQQAWDKQANFLKSQARAQSELRSMIKQYNELLHDNWELATEEQKARIHKLQAEADRIRKSSSTEGEDDGVVIIDDLPR
ncbi:MAG: terminase [Lachnospiraceae bacterium]|nr:terminase [Lachnospiraceae bacterium]